MKKIEDALLSRPGLKNEWLAYQAWAEKKPLPAGLINKHAALTDEYLRQTQSLFRQYNLDTIHAAYYLQQVRSAVDGLHKGEYRQKWSLQKSAQLYVLIEGTGFTLFNFLW